MMSRAEHMRWAKERALRYVDEGNLVDALASMGSDLRKHPETHSTASDFLLGTIGIQAVMANDVGAMRRLIEGFAE